MCIVGQRWRREWMEMQYAVREEVQNAVSER
jgi:hypothetical protein